MALLDDLKREADRARAAKQAEEARRAELEQIYRAEIVPRLLSIHRYLTEMVRHLEEVNRIVAVAYDFPVIGELDGLRQGNYRVFIDAHDSPRKMSLQCDCALPAERKFSVPAAQADELSQFLLVQQVPFTDWPVRDGHGEVKAVMFQAKLRVRAGLVFEADIDFSRIRVTTHNFEGLASREYQFGCAAIDEAWLDELGHYILRKKTVLGSLEISPEARQRLRRLAEETQERQPWDAEPTRPGLFRGLRNRLFRSDK